MNDKTQGTMSIIAAFFVIFTNMLNPMVSFTIAVAALAGLGIYNFVKK